MKKKIHKTRAVKRRRNRKAADNPAPAREEAVLLFPETPSDVQAEESGPVEFFNEPIRH